MKVPFARDEAKRLVKAPPPQNDPPRTDDLAEEVRRLRAEVAARDDFIARAAHELRNPMSSILLSATHLAFLAARDPTVPPGFRQRLQALERQAGHFVRRATALLDASRLAAGHTHIDRESFDLAEAVRAVVQELTPEADRAGCSLELSVEEAAVGSWDRACVESIAYNLISNAIKYGAGAPVGVAVVASPGVASLIVSDRGPGISREDQSRLFQRFERMHARRDRPGFGVGLWTARQFALAHGGNLSVESTVGFGSVFTASLPREIPPPHP